MKRRAIIIASLLLSALPACAAQVERHQLNLADGVEVTIEETRADTDAPPASSPNGGFKFGATRVPDTFVSKLSLSVGDRKYELDASNMYNAWGKRAVESPDGTRFLAAHCYNDRNCTLRGLFSDAGGAFVAEWQIVDGQAMRTVITDSNDIVDLFAKDISIPTFD